MRGGGTGAARSSGGTGAAGSGAASGGRTTRSCQATGPAAAAAPQPPSGTAKRPAAKLSIGSRELNALTRVGGVGGSAAPARLAERTPQGQDHTDWTSQAGPRPEPVLSAAAAAAAAQPISGSAAAAQPTHRRARRILVGERPETGPATAAAAARKPFDHLAHAVGSGKRLIDLALLMRFLDRHFACRKCAETDTHTQLGGFAKWLAKNHPDSGIDFGAARTSFVNSQSHAKAGRVRTPCMKCVEEKQHGFASVMSFECDCAGRKQHKAKFTTSCTSQGTEDNPINAQSNGRFEVRCSPPSLSSDRAATCSCCCSENARRPNSPPRRSTSRWQRGCPRSARAARRPSRWRRH